MRSRPQSGADRTGTVSRRSLVAGGLAIAVLPWVGTRAHATPESMAEAMAEVFGPAPRFRAGRIKIQLPELAENGNAVPLRIQVESAMTPADHVRRVALITQRNPQPDVAVFTLGPACGRAQIATRMRLATSQTVLALAEMNDGSWWQRGIDVIVTLAACVEG